MPALVVETWVTAATVRGDIDMFSGLEWCRCCCFGVGEVVAAHMAAAHG